MYSTPSQIFTEKIAVKVVKEPSKAKSIGVKVNFDLSGANGGKWLLDCSQEPAVVVAGAAEDARITITMTDEDFVKLGNGELRAEMAFMTGKLKVKGDMSLAIKLGQILA